MMRRSSITSWSSSEYPQCKFVPQALLGTAEDLIKTNRAAEAAAVLEDLSHQTKDEAILKKAQLLQSKVSAK